jgi:hypothetical protein
MFPPPIYPTHFFFDTIKHIAHQREKNTCATTAESTHKRKTEHQTALEKKKTTNSNSQTPSFQQTNKLKNNQ